MYQKPARIGNILYRFFTLLSLVLTVYFFFIDGGAGMVKKVLYGIWMAVSIFSGMKVVSDIVGGQHRKMRSFIGMMEQWEKYQGSSKDAVKTFLLMSIGLAVLKLAVPVVLLLLPF